MSRYSNQRSNAHTRHHKTISRQESFISIRMLAFEILCNIKKIPDFRADCHCVRCSHEKECLSRGFCEEGYWGDNCMLYDVLSMEDERHESVYVTNSSIYSNATLVMNFKCNFFKCFGNCQCNRLFYKTLNINAAWWLKGLIMRVMC